MAENIQELVVKILGKKDPSLNNVLDATEKAVRKKLGAIQDATSNLAMSAGAATLAMGGLTKIVVDKASEYEQYRTTLIAVTKSQEETNKLFQQAVDFAPKSPFEVGDIVKATVFMKSMGVEVESTQKAAANLASAFGTDLFSSVMALSKASVGSAEGFEILRNTYGITIQELAKYGAVTKDGTQLIMAQAGAAEKNRIALLKLIDTKFGTAISSQMNTAKTAFSNFNDEVDKFKAAVGATILPTVVAWTKGLNGLIEKLNSTNEATKGLLGNLLLSGTAAAAFVTAFAVAGLALMKFQRLQILFETGTKYMADKVIAAYRGMTASITATRAALMGLSVSSALIIAGGVASVIYLSSKIKEEYEWSKKNAKAEEEATNAVRDRIEAYKRVISHQSRTPEDVGKSVTFNLERQKSLREDIKKEEDMREKLGESLSNTIDRMNGGLFKKQLETKKEELKTLEEEYQKIKSISNDPDLSKNLKTSKSFIDSLIEKAPGSMLKGFQDIFGLKDLLPQIEKINNARELLQADGKDLGINDKKKLHDLLMQQSEHYSNLKTKEDDKKAKAALVEAKKLNQEILNDEAKLNNDRLDKTKEYLEGKRSLNELSTKDEIAAIERILKHYTLSTQQKKGLEHDLSILRKKLYSDEINEVKKAEDKKFKIYEDSLKQAESALKISGKNQLDIERDKLNRIQQEQKDKKLSPEHKAKLMTDEIETKAKIADEERKEVQKTLEARKRIEDEISQLTMTASQYATYQMKQKLDEMKRAGATEVDLKKYIEAAKQAEVKKTRQEEKKGEDDKIRALDQMKQKLDSLKASRLGGGNSPIIGMEEMGLQSAINFTNKPAQQIENEAIQTYWNQIDPKIAGAKDIIQRGAGMAGAQAKGNTIINIGDISVTGDKADMFKKALGNIVDFSSWKRGAESL